MRDKIRTDKVMRKVKRQSDAFNAAKAKRKEVSAGTERAKNFLGQAKAKDTINKSKQKAQAKIAAGAERSRMVIDSRRAADALKNIKSKPTKTGGRGMLDSLKRLISKKGKGKGLGRAATNLFKGGRGMGTKEGSLAKK